MTAPQVAVLWYVFGRTVTELSLSLTMITCRSGPRVLDTLTTVLMSHALYTLFVLNLRNLENNLQLPWCVPGMIIPPSLTYHNTGASRQVPLCEQCMRLLLTAEISQLENGITVCPCVNVAGPHAHTTGFRMSSQPWFRCKSMWTCSVQPLSAELYVQDILPSGYGKVSSYCLVIVYHAYPHQRCSQSRKQDFERCDCESCRLPCDAVVYLTSNQVVLALLSLGTLCYILLAVNFSSSDRTWYRCVSLNPCERLLIVTSIYSPHAPEGTIKVYALMILTLLM